MIPLRLAIDTTFIVSAVLKPDGLQRTVVLLAISKPATLYVSPAIVAEYREAMSRVICGDLGRRHRLQHLTACFHDC